MNIFESLNTIALVVKELNVFKQLMYGLNSKVEVSKSF